MKIQNIAYGRRSLPSRHNWLKPPSYKKDQYFYWHPGINPFAILKAAWQTYVQGSRRVGASTISMQVARMRFGLHSKTLHGKLWQIVRALQLEAHYSKQQLLELILIWLRMGNNIEGVGAASLLYFDKPPRATHITRNADTGCHSAKS